MGVLLIGLAACGWLAGPTGPGVEVFVVESGDTLFVLARDRGCTVDQLREWNGIEGDLIEVGQELSFHPDLCNGSTPAPRVRPKGQPRATPTTPKLRMPPEKPCLSGPDEGGLAERGMAASEGLTQAQAREALGGFVHHVLPCIEDASPSTALDLELTVACTGRVASVGIADRGDWPDAVARCVADVLRYTPFPAHGLPDGDTVQYPLRYSAPE